MWRPEVDIECLPNHCPPYFQDRVSHCTWSSSVEPGNFRNLPVSAPHPPSARVTDVFLPYSAFHKSSNPNSDLSVYRTGLARLSYLLSSSFLNTFYGITSNGAPPWSLKERRKSQQHNQPVSLELIQHTSLFPRWSSAFVRINCQKPICHRPSKVMQRGKKSCIAKGF